MAACWPSLLKFSVSADKRKILLEMVGPSLVKIKRRTNRIFEIKLYMCGFRYLNL